MSAAAPRRRSKPLLHVVLLTLFTGVGLFATLVVASDWLQALDTWSWEPATCTIVSSRTVEQPGGGEPYALEISYRYRWDGEERASDAYRHGGAGFDEISDAQREAFHFAAGARVPCWVDPDDPARSYLRRANLWRGLWIFAPLLFVAIGGGMLWFLYGPSPRPPAQARPAGPGVVAALGARFGAIKAGAFVLGFFGLFFLVGVGMLIPFFVHPALQVVEARSWRPMRCEILSSGVATHSGDDSATYSVEVLYRYEVAGREHLSSRYRFMGGSTSGYESKAEAVARMPAGAEIPCWVDPDDPFEAVIERRLSPDYLFGMVPALFALVGLGGMGFTLRAIRGMRKDAAGPSWAPAAAGADEWDLGGPSSAAYGELVLEPRTGRLGRIGMAAVAALLWNGVLSVFVWQVVESWRAGIREWSLTLFLVPFVAVGLMLLAAIPYGVLALANPRPRLRLAPGAVRAGGSAEILWTFRGAAGRIRRLRVWLESSRTRTETEVHDRGASIRTWTEPIESIEIVDRGGDAPIEFGSASFTLPEDAPPTSRGEEAISWELKLHGEIDDWPDVVEGYEIRVLPPEGDGG